MIYPAEAKKPNDIPQILAYVGIGILIIKIGVITFSFMLTLLSGVNIIIPIGILIPMIPSYFLFKALVGYKETDQSSAILQVVTFAKVTIGVYVFFVLAFIVKSVVGPMGESTDVDEAI